MTRLRKMMLVCRNWRRTLCDLPSVWAVLDLRVPNRTLSSKILRTYFRRSKGLCSELRTCEERSPQIAEVIRYATENFIRLEVIDFQIGRNFRNVFCDVGSILTLRNIVCQFVRCSAGRKGSELAAWLIDSLPKLEFAEFDLGRSRTDDHAFTLCAENSRLKHLVLQTDDADLNVMDMVSKAPNLQTLHLRGWSFVPDDSPLDFSHLQQLIDLTISSCEGCQYPALPQSLKMLDIRRSRFSSNTFNWGPVPELQSLILEFLNDRLVVPLVNPQVIKRVHLKNIHCAQDGSGRPKQELRKLFPSTTIFPALQGLDLAANHWLSDDDVDELAIRIPNLKQLNISYSGITGVSVKKVLTSCVQLEYLNLDGCLKISPDAVEWGRARGVKVDFLFPDDPWGGKKVRVS